MFATVVNLKYFHLGLELFIWKDNLSKRPFSHSGQVLRPFTSRERVLYFICVPAADQKVYAFSFPVLF